MKLERRTFQVFWDVHAWGGVVCSLLLYLMFFAGAFALFRNELDAWAEPNAAPSVGGTPALQPAFEQLVREERALGSARVSFSIHDSGLDAELLGSGGERQFRFDAERGRLEPHFGKLGDFLYRLHYLGPIPNGIYVAGVAAMGLLLALVTGVLIHLKDLVRQWFQFRPRQVARTWSSDLHKVLGLLGLPFQLFYAWSGAVLCLGYVCVQPAFTSTVFHGDGHAADAAHGYVASPPATGKPAAALPNLDALLAGAQRAVPGLKPHWVSLEHVGDEASALSIYGKVPGVAFGNAQVTVRARDGQVLRATSPAAASSLQRFEAWFYGLHYAAFGSYAVKWLFAALAAGTCAVIVSGNLIWLERRDRQRARVGNRILQRVTVAGCAGLPLAVGCLFLANRALPATLAERVRAEQALFWISWAAALLWALLAPLGRRVAAQQVLVAGMLFAAAAIRDFTLRPEQSASAALCGVDGALLLLAVTCAWSARLIAARARDRENKRAALSAAR